MALPKQPARPYLAKGARRAIKPARGAKGLRSSNASALPEAVVRSLKKAYPDAHCELVFASPLQLLVATILSAQCTDKRVNLVTQELFRELPTAADLAQVPRARLERIIKSTGFFRAKAANIQACCRELVERFDGQVPQDLETLVQLPGVGRKTANVVLGTAFGQASGVVVDTHVKRLAHRMGLTQNTQPEKVELDLMASIPQREWIAFSHRMIWHGRLICKARAPACEACACAVLCPRVGVS